LARSETVGTLEGAEIVPVRASRAEAVEASHRVERRSMLRMRTVAVRAVMRIPRGAPPA
jgi:hypothetical protein